MNKRTLFLLSLTSAVFGAIIVLLAVKFGGAWKGIEQEKKGAQETASAPAQVVAKSVSMIEPVSEKDRAAANDLVSKISQGKATVTEVFRGHGGFTGVVVSTGGDGKFIGWMPAARDTLIVGAMFDQDGKNVTQAEMLSRGYAKTEAPQAEHQAGPAPSQSTMQKAIDTTAGFMEGVSGPVVTAFVDYNCEYCRKFYERSRPLVARGAMRIRWVPVDILTETSLPKAAAVLGNMDPVQAMAMAESGTLNVPPVTNALKAKIGGNTAVLNLLGNGNAGTPTLVMRKADGTLNISPGLPADLIAYLSAGR
jgi:thiol:disulfide interchange protein DsbG